MSNTTSRGKKNNNELPCNSRPPNPVAPGFVRGPKQNPLPQCELPFTEMKRGKKKGGSSTGAPQRGATQQGPSKKETPPEE